MKTHKRSLWLALLLVGIIMFDSSIYSHANATHSEKSYDMLSILFHVPYLDATGIDVYYQSERQELMQKMKELLATKPVHAASRGTFSHYYAITVEEDSEYLYYGKIKDNRPDGFGILTTGKVSMEDSATFPYLVYAGSFSKGKYDGYGVCFACSPDTYKMYTSNSGIGKSLVDRGIISKEMLPILYVYDCARVTHESTWKKGKINGKTNIFTLTSENTPPNGYWGGPFSPDILSVSSAENGKQSGDAKYYVNGIIRYDGEMKKGDYDGSGTSYYENGNVEYIGGMKKGQYNGFGTSYFENGKVKYTGNWKNNLYHGQGTLYSEDGKIVYEGKWKKGDYAS